MGTNSGRLIGGVEPLKRSGKALALSVATAITAVD